jgi:hypothetical protein
LVGQNVHLLVFVIKRASAFRGTYFYLLPVHIDMYHALRCGHVALHPFQVAQGGSYLIFLIARLGRLYAQIIFA